MAGSRGANTMTEQLQGLLGQLAQMKAAPDADIAYLTSLETQALKFLRAPFEKQRMEAAMGGPQLGGGPPQAGPAEQLLMGAPAGPPPGMPMSGGGAGVPGLMNGPSMPPVDELRRLMEQPAM